MRGWLLDQLQQRVPRRVGELVRLVDDVDLESPLDRLQHGALSDLADVVDPTLRCGVHLDHVERRAVGDGAGDARVGIEVRARASLGVQCLGEDPRHGGLAGAAWAGEEIGLPYLVSLDRVPQGAHDRFLPHDVPEIERSILAIERGHPMIQAGRRRAGRGGDGGTATPTGLCRVR